MSADRDNSGLGNEELASAGESTLESAGSRTRLVEIRCGFAEMARKEADAADLRAREVRRAYDEGVALLAPLLAAVDPVVTKAHKEKAHAAFQSAVRGARVRNQVETAASVWLAEINRINNQYRAAQARAKHEREAVDSLLSQVDKLADTAESTSAMAAAAAEACRSAREDSAVGPAAAASAAAPPVPSPPEGSALSPEAAIVPALAATFRRAPEPEKPTGRLKLDWLVIDLRSPQPQAIIRLLRRDDGIMTSLVEHLAGPDPGIHRFWQMLLSNFADSIEGAAIDDAWFEFPPGSPFWDIFTAEQAREVARGLSALGFRYDGFGAFADDRVPSRRDLALAVGAAGLLPARIRYWPKPEETAELYRNVRVAADAFVAARAPTLTLGELVHLLGRRAHLLADLWNDWPRVRPLLFSTAY